jgi:O-antigen/teichoic acid export membrane protein
VIGMSGLLVSVGVRGLRPLSGRAQGMRVRRALDRSVAGSLATGFGGQLVLVASGVLVARALRVEGRGELAVIVLVPSVLSQLGTVGIPLALTYFIARDPDGSRPLLRSLGFLIGIQMILLSALQIGIFWLLLHDNERTVMLVATPVMAALIAQQYGLAVLQGQRRFTAFNTLRIAPAATYTLAMIPLFVLGSADLMAVVLAWTLTNVVVGVALGAIAIRYAALGTPGPSSYSLTQVGRFGASAVLGSYSPAEILRVDQAVVAFSLSRAALGLYVVALAFTNLPRFLSQSVGMVAYPRIAAAAREPGDVRGLVRLYLLLVLLVTGIVVGLLEIAVSWFIPWLFGADFAGAVTTARILLIASFLLATRRVLTDIAQGLGYPAAGTVAEIVNLALALPLIAVAAPRYGIEGAAVALTVGAAGSLVALAFMVYQRTRRFDAPDLPVEVGIVGS